MSNDGEFRTQCPYCGSDNLKASVACYYADVPLGKDGYFCPDGQLVEDSIDGISCGTCHKDIAVSYYYGASDNPQPLRNNR